MSTYQSIAGIVRYWANETPDAPCLSQGDLTRTWTEVFDRSMRAASALEAAGVQPQDRIAYLAKNDSAFFELSFGASMVGAVTMGVNFRLAPPEMLHILNHSQATVLMVGSDFVDEVKSFADELSTVHTIIVLGGRVDGYTDYETWLAGHEPRDPQAPVSDDETVMQMYTSGTTGNPKGVMYSNAAVGATLTVAGDLGVVRESVVMVGMPLFHASGASWGMFSLALGSHCVIMTDLIPTDILGAIDQHKITKTMLVPVLLQALLATPTLATTDLSALETIVYAGSPISPTLLAQCVAAFGCDFVQIYGMTETSTATILSPDDHRDGDHVDRLASAGRASTGVDVRVVDPETGVDMAEGEVGEVWIKAPTNTHGYWLNPTETAATITADGYVRTGDGGALIEGYLFLRDRIKDMVVSGGENVYPIEVENVLATLPDVADAAVIGVPSDRWGETVKAIIVAAPGTSPDEQQIIASCREQLAGYKCPTSVDIVDELPRNPSGKILKRQLREPYWSAAERGIN